MVGPRLGFATQSGAATNSNAFCSKLHVLDVLRIDYHSQIRCKLGCIAPRALGLNQTRAEKREGLQFERYADWGEYPTLQVGYSPISGSASTTARHGYSRRLKCAPIHPTR